MLDEYADEPSQGGDEDAASRLRDIEIRLHPEDAKVLQPWLPQWPDARVLHDPQLARGDVRIHGDGVRIDARTDARLQAALAAVLNPVGGVA